MLFSMSHSLLNTLPSPNHNRPSIQTCLTLHIFLMTLLLHPLSTSTRWLTYLLHHLMCLNLMTYLGQLILMNHIHQSNFLHQLHIYLLLSHTMIFLIWTDPTFPHSTFHKNLKTSFVSNRLPLLQTSTTSPCPPYHIPCTSLNIW